MNLILLLISLMLVLSLVKGFVKEASEIINALIRLHWLLILLLVIFLFVNESMYFFDFGKTNPAKTRTDTLNHQSLPVSFQDDRLDANAVANIEFRTPGKMRVGKSYDAYALIHVLPEIPTAERLQSLIQDRIDDLQQADADKKDPEAQIEFSDTIIVSPRLEVRLIDPHEEYFDIKPVTEPIQYIQHSSPAIWQWSLRPLQAGEHMVYLKIIARLKTADAEELQDLEVYRKKIAIRVPLRYAVSGFFAKNWQYLLSVLIIPLFLWIRTKYPDWKKKLWPPDPPF